MATNDKIQSSDLFSKDIDSILTNTLLVSLNLVDAKIDDIKANAKSLSNIKIKNDNSGEELKKITKATEALKKATKELTEAKKTQKEIQREIDKEATRQAKESEKRIKDEQKRVAKAAKEFEKAKQIEIKALAKAAKAEREFNKALTKQVRSIEDLRKQTNALVKTRDKFRVGIDGTAKDFQKLTKRISDNTIQLKAQDAQIQRFQRNVGNYRSALDGIGSSFKSLSKFAASGAVFLGGGELLQAGVQELKKASEEIDLITKGLTNATAESVNLTRSLSAQGFEIKEVIDFANSSLQDFGVSGSQALREFDDAIARGGANSAQYLDVINEYKSSFKDAGLDIKESTALLIQFDKAGQDIDKASDLLREFTIRFRELTPATEKALTAAGLNFKELRKEVASGETTYADALKQISATTEQMEEGSKKGAILADVFGSQAEDITSLVSQYAKLNTEITDYEITQTALEQANKRLSTAFIELTSG